MLSNISIYKNYLKMSGSSSNYFYLLQVGSLKSDKVRVIFFYRASHGNFLKLYLFLGQLNHPDSWLLHLYLNQTFKINVFNSLYQIENFKFKGFQGDMFISISQCSKFKWFQEHISFIVYPTYNSSNSNDFKNI